MVILGGLEPKRYSVTPEGLIELEQQLHALKKRRAEVTQELREATSQTANTATLEDSIFIDSQSRAAQLDDLIFLLERVIGLAEVIQKPEESDQVQIGSRLAVLVDDKEHTYTIVGPIEANPAFGKISNESPLGRSLLGRKVNDRLEIVAPGRVSRAVTILRIES